VHGGVGVIPLHPVESSSSPRSVLYPICTVSYPDLLFASLLLSLNSHSLTHSLTHSLHYSSLLFILFYFLILLYPFVSIRSFFLFHLSLSPSFFVYLCCTPNTKPLQLQLQPNCTAIRRRRRNKREKGIRNLGPSFFFSSKNI